VNLSSLQRIICSWKHDQQKLPLRVNILFKYWPMEIEGSDSILHPWKRTLYSSRQPASTMFDLKQIYYDKKEIRYPFLQFGRKSKYVIPHTQAPSQYTVLRAHDFNQSAVFHVQEKAVRLTWTTPALTTVHNSRQESSPFIKFKIWDLGFSRRGLMMQAASTSETSVNFYQSTRRNNPEDGHLHVQNPLALPSLQMAYGL
jgi:hypothetical protein